jgi:hypothetical protein
MFSDSLTVQCRTPDEGYLIIEHDLFIAYIERHFYAGRTGAEYEYSPYKLHISLSKNAYLEHRDAIITMLTAHLSKNEGYLKEFKFVDPEQARLKIQEVKDAIKWMSEYKSVLEGRKNKKFDMHDFKMFFSAYYPDIDEFSYPELNEVDTYLRCLNDDLNSEKRFLVGDQFTIYIPKNYHYHAILALCNEINAYLTAAKVKPGNHTDIVSLLSSHISLRQPYLMKDYDEFNACQSIDRNKRIDGTPSKDDAAEVIQRRIEVKIEQDKSKLYRKLVKDLTHAASTIKDQETSHGKRAGLFGNTLFSKRMKKRNEKFPCADHDVGELSSLMRSNTEISA